MKNFIQIDNTEEEQVEHRRWTDARMERTCRRRGHHVDVLKSLGVRHKGSEKLMVLLATHHSHYIRWMVAH